MEDSLTLVTGSTGFIGRHVVAAARSAGTPIRTASRSGIPTPDHRTVDLCDPRQVDGLCEAVRAVIHCASAIGSDPATVWATNARGTETLLAEAARANVINVVYLSTAAVYQDGAHQGPTEDELSTGPGSETSKSRLVAERLVLEHGGIVVRPHLVVGAGDRWVVPGALAAIELLAPARTTARHTIIEAEDLARLLLALSRSDTSGVFHAGYLAPVTLDDLLRGVPQDLRTPRHEQGVIGDRHATPSPPERRLRSLALQDHYYDCHKIWSTTDLEPLHETQPITADAVEWYRSLLTP